MATSSPSPKAARCWMRLARRASILRRLLPRNAQPVNACRICVVEVEGSRTLVPACSRKAEEAWWSEPIGKGPAEPAMILEFLASSVDVSLAHDSDLYEAIWCRPERFGPPQPPQTRDAARPGFHAPRDGAQAAVVSQPAKIDNELYMRDYSKCILCYKCVEACGGDAQNTFAIAVAGRGFDARISTEYAVPLPESACVYCGNCIGVCPTGALMFESEYKCVRQGHGMNPARPPRTRSARTAASGVRDPSRSGSEDCQSRSPIDSGVTHGNLCVEGPLRMAVCEYPRKVARGRGPHKSIKQ